MDYKQFLKTPEWQEIRTMVLERADYRCQVCNSPEALHIHHRTYERTGWDEFISDLIVLCRTCHATFHQIRKDKKKPTVRLHKDGRRKDSGENALKKAKARRPPKEQKPANYSLLYADGRTAKTTLTPPVLQMLRKDPAIRSILRCK